MQATQNDGQDRYQTLDMRSEEAARARLLSRLAASGVKEADLAALREMIDNGALTRPEADSLAAIEAAPTRKCDGWAAFFIDAVTEHAVWSCRPTGVVSEAQGEWLIAMADRCGTNGALGALANVAAEAHRVPLWFAAAVRARLARRGETAQGLTRVA